MRFPLLSIRPLRQAARIKRTPQQRFDLRPNRFVRITHPCHIRLDIELWQYQRMLPDRLLVTKTVERTLAYNVVTREFKVAALKGETRLVHTTRDLRDARALRAQLS